MARSVAHLACVTRMREKTACLSCKDRNAALVITQKQRFVLKTVLILPGSFGIQGFMFGNEVSKKLSGINLR
jgi:hypothetical protein